MLVLPSAEVNQAPAFDVQTIQEADQSPRELVLIDAGVEDHQALLQSILQNNSDSILDVRVIDSNRDGLTQISAILASSDQRFDAILIISHGDDGRVQLGNSTLSDDNLAEYARRDRFVEWCINR